ncbi:MAG: M23 family metallopeptidase [Paracoccaceae bacterium]|nr:M23 family metallopeptidase [Paracoccaceae bacterium]
MLTSCRSTINEPVTQTTLNSVDQIDTLNREDPDNRGIITYDTYQILIANGSETISEIANRLNINEEKLALYNGLIPNYRPRKNEMIALPEDQFISPSGWSTEITRATIENEQSSQQKISSANNPLRHRVKEGETVYSLAREYKVSVNSIAAWNGLGPDLDIKTGREIIIPAATSSLLKTTQSKKTSEVKINERKEPSNIKEQKSIKTVETKLSDKKKNNTPEQKPSLPEVEIISVKPFIAPVMGIIVSKYSQDKGSQNNNGIDYETEIGSSVNAVADGKIVLVSDIVGGNGKIVLIRHDSELITIYGRLTNVTIEKDQDVDQGQNIGVVIKDSQTSKGLMHFEVRKGMKSVDPETMIR